MRIKMAIFSPLLIFFFVTLNVNAATLSWTASKTKNVTYNIYVNDVKVKTGINDLTYTDNALDIDNVFGVSASKYGLESAINYDPANIVAPAPPSNVIVVDINIKISTE